MDDAAVDRLVWRAVMDGPRSGMTPTEAAQVCRLSLLLVMAAVDRLTSPERPSGTGRLYWRNNRRRVRLMAVPEITHPPCPPEALW